MSAILFVCTGNICRSPIAEGLFRAASARLAEPWRVDSAGLHARDGEAPTAPAIAVAARHGVDIAGLRARRFAVADFAHFDCIVALDRGHLDHLAALAPAAWGGRLGLFVDRRGRPYEVPDPYGRTSWAYRRAGHLIAEGVDVLLDELENAGEAGWPATGRSRSPFSGHGR
ncbi:MAG: low molecular weight protein-tyrosine-phosphatase [Gammaproteobacteria bacterium]